MKKIFSKTYLCPANMIQFNLIVHDDELNRGKVKKQIVMDALEMYYDELFKKKDGREDGPCKEQQIEQLKRELREEMWQEILGAVAGGVMGGRTLSSCIGKPEKKTLWKMEHRIIVKIPGIAERHWGRLAVRIEGDGMAKTGIRMIVQLLGCMFKGVVWIMIHVLKLALAVLEIILLLAGSMLKIFLLVLV